MAIPNASGVEVIRTALFEDVVNVNQKIIIGEQHHIYTIISVFIWCDGLNAAGDHITVYLTAYDGQGGDSAQPINLFRFKPTAIGDTYVFNDRFSFNGTEGSDMTGGFDAVAEQDLVADQATTTAQKLMIATSDASTPCDVTVTFIDQNNA